MEKNNLVYLLAIYKDSETGNFVAWKIDKINAKKIVPEEVIGKELEKEFDAKRIL